MKKTANNKQAIEDAVIVGTPAKSIHLPKKTSVAKLLHQKALNPSLSNQQLAAINGTSKQAVGQMFKRYGINEKYLETFKAQRADIFAGVQETVLASFTDDDIKKASVRDRTILLGTIYDKERLERGQSTSNVATILATAVIEAGKQWTKPAKPEMIEAEEVAE